MVRNKTEIDSVPFRGGMVGSDDAIVTYSQRAFTPVVQGIARTQARIEVRQNGYVIYNTTVAPGPYALTDLPVSGGGCDLQVTVFEANGTRQVFTVHYIEPAVALRQGGPEIQPNGRAISVCSRHFSG